MRNVFVGLLLGAVAIVVGCTTETSPTVAPRPDVTPETILEQEAESEKARLEAIRDGA